MKKIGITAKTDLVETLQEVCCLPESAAAIRQAITAADTMFSEYGVNRRDRVGSTLNVGLERTDNNDKILQLIDYTIKHGPERWALVEVSVGKIGDGFVFGETYLEVSKWAAAIAVLRVVFGELENPNVDMGCGDFNDEINGMSGEMAESFRVLVEED